MTALREENSHITRLRDKIAERAKKLYKKLYSSDLKNNKVPQTDKDISTIEQTLKVPDITLTKVERSIYQLKRNKAPGQDNITSHILKDAGPPSTKDPCHTLN